MAKQYITPGGGFINDAAGGREYLMPGMGFINEAAATGLNIKVKSDGGWKAVNSGMVKVNGSWKAIAAIQVKTPGGWKQV